MAMGDEKPLAAVPNGQRFVCGALAAFFAIGVVLILAMAPTTGWSFQYVFGPLIPALWACHFFGTVAVTGRGPRGLIQMLRDRNRKSA
jgi:hypothetical protein